MLLRRRMLVLQCVLFCVIPAAAQLASAYPNQQVENLKQMTLEQLAQVQVTTPNKAPESAFTIPAAIYVLTGEQILRAGVLNIPDALRLVPGVEVAQIDASKWSVGIRGFGSRLSRSVLVMIDGRTVYTTLLAGTYWEVQDLVIADIDRIEVIRGPGGTIWGPNAVNGVINIITRKASDTEGVLAELGGGSQRWGEANLRYGAAHGRTAYRVFAKSFANGPEYHPDGNNFDEWRSVRGGFRLDHELQNDASFTLEGDLYYEVTGQGVSATTYNPPNTSNVFGNADLSGGDIVGIYRRKFDGDVDFQLQAYYDRANRHELNFADLRDTFDVDLVLHQKFARRHDLTYGVGTRFSYGRNPVVVSGLYFDPQNRLDHLLTGFFQDEIQLVENRLKLTLGTKLLNTNFVDFEAEPSARLMWTPTPNTGFWAAFTHAVRTPSDGERDFFLSSHIGTAPNGMPFFARFNANRNFQSEQLNGWEAGFRRLVAKKLSLDVAAFFNRYTDLFSEDITGDPFVETSPAPAHLLLPAEFGNGLQGQTKGIEIAPEWQATSFWRLRGSYSYLHMDLEKAPNSKDIGSIPGIVGSSPQHQVSVDSGFDMAKSVKLDLIVRYVSALPAQHVPAYVTGDANFRWQFKPHFGLTLTGRNLFQPHHPEFGGDPGPLVGIERHIYAQLTWTR